MIFEFSGHGRKCYASALVGPRDSLSLRIRGIRDLVNRRTQTMTGNSNAKPWNVALPQVEPDERLYRDFKEEAKINEISVKFKTSIDRIKFWVGAHEEFYTNDQLWEFKQNLVTLKNKEKSESQIVKFHLSTGLSLFRDQTSANGGTNCMIKWDPALT